MDVNRCIHHNVNLSMKARKLSKNEHAALRVNVMIALSNPATQPERLPDAYVHGAAAAEVTANATLCPCREQTRCPGAIGRPLSISVSNQSLDLKGGWNAAIDKAALKDHATGIGVRRRCFLGPVPAVMPDTPSPDRLPLDPPAPPWATAAAVTLLGGLCTGTRGIEAAASEADTCAGLYEDNAGVL